MTRSQKELWFPPCPLSWLPHSKRSQLASFETTQAALQWGPHSKKLRPPAYDSLGSRFSSLSGEFQWLESRLMWLKPQVRFWTRTTRVTPEFLTCWNSEKATDYHCNLLNFFVVVKTGGHCLAVLCWSLPTITQTSRECACVSSLLFFPPHTCPTLWVITDPWMGWIPCVS